MSAVTAFISLFSEPANRDARVEEFYTFDAASRHARGEGSWPALCMVLENPCLGCAMKNLLSAFFFASVSELAFAAPVIDVNFDPPVLPTPLSSALATSGVAGQYFTSTADKITGAGFRLRNGVGNGLSSYEITLRATESSDALAFGSTSSGNNFGMIDVFWDAVSIEIGQTYFLQIVQTTSSQSPHSFGGSNGNQYAGGYAIANGLILSNSDFYFRTFAGDTTDPVPTPEPATLSLFGLGAIGLGLSRRRKNAVA